MFLLVAPPWSIRDSHYLAQKEPSSPSVSCKGSFLQIEFGQQIPHTQGSSGSLELKCSKCVYRDSQPHCSRSMAQTDSISSVSEVSFSCCVNTVVCTAVLNKICPLLVSADGENTVRIHMRAARI